MKSKTTEKMLPIFYRPKSGISAPIGFPDPGSVKFTSGLPISAETIQLYPGFNEVPQAVWEAMTTHPVTKIQIESGQMRVLDMTQPSDRIIAAKGSYHLSRLRGWLETEEDSEVIKAIEAQIKLLLKFKVPEQYSGAGGSFAQTFTAFWGSQILFSKVYCPSFDPGGQYGGARVK